MHGKSKLKHRGLQDHATEFVDMVIADSSHSFLNLTQRSDSIYVGIWMLAAKAPTRCNDFTEVGLLPRTATHMAMWARSSEMVIEPMFCIWPDSR